MIGEEEEAHGGLRLETIPIGVGASKEEEIHNRWVLYPTVVHDLMVKVGLHDPVEPQFDCPELTAGDLTTPDSREYTERYAQINSWFGYLSEVTARYTAQLREVEAEMEDIESNIRDRMRKQSTRTTGRGVPKPPGTEEMKDAVNLDPRYLELKTKQLYLQQARGLLQARVDRIERDLKLISRQVEIRRQEFDQNNRGSAIAGRGGLPRPGTRYPSG